MIATGPAAQLTPATALLGDTACTGQKPIVILAASGGGTRAALYTASVLDGLAQIDRLDRVRLVSGISGGGAALAYFVSRRPELVNKASPVWNEFFDRMAEPYIQDVLNGAGEWRIVGRYRLGTLLEESFRNRWQLATRQRLGDIEAPGMILNSSLVGHFDRAEVCPTATTEGCDGSIEAVEARHREANSIALAPGRLVFTNLGLRNDFATTGLGPQGMIRLPIVVVNRLSVRLTEAAAMNANFPPVFPNAAADVDDRYRYWATDGGAIDNRAMETLVYAVARAFDEESWATCEHPPDIHMIVADASAFSNTFQQDRAIGTALAAGAPFASQLVTEVFRDIEVRYAEHHGRIWFHYLPMPNLLRRSGAFGTHWMLQPRIRILHNGAGRNLHGQEVARIIRAMHGDSTNVLTAREREVLDWSRTDVDRHGDLWDEIVRALR